MAAPVVAGTVALMLQANPALTPNLVKAILQYTAEHRAGYDDLTQGAGFLNARGAVQLAKSFAGGSRRCRGRRRIRRRGTRTSTGAITASAAACSTRSANAWRTDVIWGASTAGNGDHITWGTVCGADCDSVIRGAVAADSAVWGTSCADARAATWSGVPSPEATPPRSCGTGGRDEHSRTRNRRRERPLLESCVGLLTP